MKAPVPDAAITTRKPVPRGIATAGPAILSYGFRPFFLLAGIVAVVDMIVWIGALSGLWPVGGSAGPISWHAHEMLFGYAAAAACGFVLTAVPNWTGRLPVSGPPLLVLVVIWVAGRLCMGAPWILGEAISALVDCLFFPMLVFVVAREVIIGKNWQNLRVAAALGSLALLNGCFHAAPLLGWDEMAVLRLTVSVYVLLISQMGGRIIPSFTRNYLAKRFAPLPRPAGRLDDIVLAVTLVALLCWSILPEWPGTAGVALIAATLQTVRLVGWRGWASRDEPLLLVLHVGYAFVPLGLLGIGLAAVGLVSAPSALHVLTVGAIGLMTMAVMSRASRGHTGRALTASLATTVSYALLFLSAILRPLAELFPDAYHIFLDLSGGFWILSFGIFVVEHGPMLVLHSMRKKER
ncbi:MAG: NnrS family protein [Devosia sp.]